MPTVETLAAGVPTMAAGSLPSGGRIAFVSSPYGEEQGIFVMDSVGIAHPVVTSRTFNVADPAWSPDGSRLVLAADFEGAIGVFDLFTARSDGRGLTRLTSGPESEDQPAWSPDGTRLAYRVGGALDGRVYVALADGTGAKPLTGETWIEGHPVWSPSGDRIAFVCGDYPFGLCIADENGELVITLSSGVADAPLAWDPLRERIVYTGSSDCKLHSLSLRDGVSTPLTSGPGCDRGPTISPDCLSIAFSSNRSLGSVVGSSPYGDLYVTSADGSELRLLYAGPGDNYSPAWYPACLP